jgi:hypothetical protein
VVAAILSAPEARAVIQTTHRRACPRMLAPKLHARFLRLCQENASNLRLMVWTAARLYTASQWAQDVLSNIRTKRGGSEMEVTTIGIDLAKNVFAVCAADSSGRVAAIEDPLRL